MTTDGRSARPSSLAGLEAINWGARKDCQGDTDRVPLLLRQLWVSYAPDKDELMMRLVPHYVPSHRCVSGDATVAAVPFLARLAQDPRTPCRGFVLEVLLLIAEAAGQEIVGSDFWDVPARWFGACGRALGAAHVTEWFTMLDHEPDWNRRRDVLRLLAIAARFEPQVTGLLWVAVLDARDAGQLAERLIALAYATLDRDAFDGGPHGIEDWAVQLKDWLEEPTRPAQARTVRAARLALEHLPDWLDADSVEALSELVHEELPHRPSRP